MLQVCAFGGEADVDMRGKVIIRLRNITEIQTQLESCMAGKGLSHSLCLFRSASPVSSVGRTWDS